MFRFKRSVPAKYDEQGFVYFYSKRYKSLDIEGKRKVRRLCHEAAGEYEKALFEFVTTNAGAKAICAKHFISRSTLERVARKYYLLFLEES